MKVTDLTQDQFSAKFNAEAGKEELDPIHREVFGRLRKQVKADGFREGRAPNNVVERELGSQRVQQEFLQHALDRLFAMAASENNIRPIEQPKVDIKEFVPYEKVVFSVEVDVFPEITMPDYRKVRVDFPELEVTDEEIDSVVERLRQRAAERKEVKRAAKNGDEVTVDFGGTKDGKEVPGASAKQQPIVLGSGHFIPGFEDELIGLKPGDEKTFDIAFPKDYHEQSLQGETLTFAVKVQTINEMQPIADDAEFVKKIGPFENLEQLRSDIRTQIEAEKQQGAMREYEEKVLDELLKRAKVPVPPRMLETTMERSRKEIEDAAKQADQKLEEYLEARGQNKKDWEKEAKQGAERRITSALLVTEVANAEDVKVTTEEVQQRAQLMAYQMQDPEFIKQLSTPQAQRELANQMLSEKTVQLLVTYAKGEEPKADKTESKLETA